MHHYSVHNSNVEMGCSSLTMYGICVMWDIYSVVMLRLKINPKYKKNDKRCEFKNRGGENKVY